MRVRLLLGDSERYDSVFSKGDNLMRILMLKAIPLVVIASFCCSCGKKELDRDTAMNLLRGRVVGTLACHVAYQYESGNFRFMPPSEVPKLNRIADAYRQLIRAGVLTCQPNFPGSDTVMCQPGPKLAGNAPAYSDAITVPAGSLVASAVTGITKTGDNSAMAQVQLSFQPTPLYSQYQAAFETLDGEGIMDRPVRNYLRASAQATFQLFDDGWRLQTVGLQ